MDGASAPAWVILAAVMLLGVQGCVAQHPATTTSIPDSCMSELLRNILVDVTDEDIHAFELRLSQLETPVNEASLPTANAVIMSVLLGGAKNFQKLRKCLEGDEAAVCQYTPPCSNGGRCVFNNNTATGIQSYQCHCSLGFAGLRCGQAISPCARHRPCLNGAMCRAVGSDRYKCLCKPLYEGSRCQNRWMSGEMHNITSAMASVVSRLETVERESAKGLKANSDQVSEVLTRIEEQVNDRLETLESDLTKRMGQFEGKNVMATSCQDIKERSNGTLPSGHYIILSLKAGTIRTVYCEMVKYGGGWTRVVYINPDEQGTCPGTMRFQNPGVKVCTRHHMSSGCAAATFEPATGEYSEVMSYVTGYRTRSMDAFHSRSGAEISAPYVDGVSVTYGSSPMKHIWTYASGYYDHPLHGVYHCPCSLPAGSSPPSFVGDDFYCSDLGAVWQNWTFTAPSHLWSVTAPCSVGSQCCEDADRPWFHRRLGRSVQDVIKLRICSDQEPGNEDVGVDRCEIFVR